VALGDAVRPRFEEPGAKGLAAGRGVHGAPEEARAAAAMGWRGGSCLEVWRADARFYVS
jgi:hypothetical protein